MAYRIEVIAEAMGNLPAPNSSEEAIANYILGHLRGYRQSAVGRQNDVEFIKTAIQAYAKLIQDADIKIT